MTPAERLDRIKAIKPVLLGMNTSDIFLHVSEFTSEFVGSWDYWLNQPDESAEVEAWCTWLLRQMSSVELDALHDYLVGTGPAIDTSLLPWRDGEFRLFLSHIASERHFLTLLSSSLGRYGVHGFVAHEHIDPGQQWSEVIRSCLFTCDALVAVLHERFHESDWTDQEVGFVMGQHKFAIAIRAGIDPYGLLGAVQGIPAPPQLFAPNPAPDSAASVLAREIVQVLAAEKRTQIALRDAMVTRLAQSRSWNMSNEVIDVLRQCPRITKDQYLRLREAERHNVEVGQAFNVGPFLNEIAPSYDVTADDIFGDDEPF